MEENRYQALTSSSKNALAWAFTRARQRASSIKDSSASVSAKDLLVGVFLAHPNNSDPLQLFQYFQTPLEQLNNFLRADGDFAPDDAPSSAENLSQMPPLTEEAEKIIEESYTLSQHYNP